MNPETVRPAPPPGIGVGNGPAGDIQPRRPTPTASKVPSRRAGGTIDLQETRHAGDADPTGTIDPRPPLRRGRSRTDVAVIGGGAVAIWALVILLGRAWGIALEGQGQRLVLYTPPILGGYRYDRDLIFLVPVAVAGALVAATPILAERLRWPLALVAGAVGSLVWWVALASVEGFDGLTRGLYWSAEYEAARPSFVGAPRQFLATFTELLPTYSVQLRGHPPGLPMVLAVLDRIGLGGERWAAAVTLVVAASGVVAVLIAVREVVGEATARRALPFLVLAPTATWMAVSFDALFAGVAAWLVTLMVLAGRRSGRRAVVLAIGAGACAATSILLSYGMVLMGCLVVAVAVALRAWRPLVIATITAVVLTVALVPFGFWWLTGLEATRTEYYTLGGVERPSSFFVFSNLSAWFLTIGPATVAALAFLRDRRLWILVGGGLASVAVADLSGLSNAEVERIWLPFTIWVLPAAAVLGGRRWATRGWLAAQAASAIVLAWFIRAHW